MTVMFDSVNLDQIPADAPAVAGYTSGRWPTYPQLAARWPNAHRLSLAVTATADADCLDIEPGDATPWDAPSWVRRQQARGLHRPCLYSSVSTMQQIVNILDNAGIRRDEVRLWAAHYTHTPHICGPSCAYNLKVTVDATQWTDRAFGRNLDQSLCADDFFALPAPPITPPPPQEDDMAVFQADDPHGGFWRCDETGAVWNFDNDGNPATPTAARMLGTLTGHADWNAGAGKTNGPVVAFHYWPAGDGYLMVTRDGGGAFHPYHFPGDGSLR